VPSIRAFIPGPIKALVRPGVAKFETWRSRRKLLKARSEIASGYYRRNLELMNEWVSRDTEISNFYYDLTTLNRRHLAGLIATLTAVPANQVEPLFRELDNDETLREHLTRGVVELGFPKDVQFLFGRRIGWYAMVRLTKPRVVIETGVDHGVGSCVLCAALLKNAEEGHPGRYYGTEIRHEAGRLLNGPYREVGEVIYGDSIATLREFPEEIDLLVNDSDHSAEYEYREYQAVAGKLGPRAVILGDNSHLTDSLYRFAGETGRCFLFFREEPKDHWYPGAGIGFAFQRERVS
jgi:predicted O-methyltransferase YrrM